MKDKFGRTIDYMRISVTDRCNLRCVHCMPEEGVQLFGHEDILSYEEIKRIAEAAAGLGIKNFRLTGGEPLARKGIESLVEALSSIPGAGEIALTTNGTLLKEKLPALMKAGLKSVNISLNAISPGCFKAFTRTELSREAMEGIDAALNTEGLKVKINCVPTEINRRELASIALIAKNTDACVRFIEMMPIGYGKQFGLISTDELMEEFSGIFGAYDISSEAHGNGPAKYVRYAWFKSDIGFISALSHKFCSECNRIRLTADGKLKACLQYEAGLDLKAMIRGGSSDEQLKNAIESCILSKPEGHSFCAETDENNKEGRLMSQIGG